MYCRTTTQQAVRIPWFYRTGCMRHRLGEIPATAAPRSPNSITGPGGHPSGDDGALPGESTKLPSQHHPAEVLGGLLNEGTEYIQPLNRIIELQAFLLVGRRNRQD